MQRLNLLSVSGAIGTLLTPRAIVIGVLSAFMQNRAHANAGTTLMWASAYLLLFGNALIGFVEGALLIVVFKVSWRRALLMIPANYVSMFTGAGALYLVGLWSSLPVTVTVVFDHMKLMLSIMAIAMWCMTVLVEAPFCYVVLVSRKRTVRMAVVASLVANTMSHVVMVGLLAWASDLSLVTNTTLTTDLNQVLREDAEVYYISADSMVGVQRVSLRDHTHGMIAECEGHAFTRLSTRPESESVWALIACVDAECDNVCTVAQCLKGTVHLPVEGLGAEAADYRPHDRRPYSVRTNGWGGGFGAGSMDVYVTGPATVSEKPYMQLGLEVPGLTWKSRYASITPRGQVIYELGPCIVVLNVESRVCVLLGVGQSPIVILPGGNTGE